MATDRKPMPLHEFALRAACAPYFPEEEQTRLTSEGYVFKFTGPNLYVYRPDGTLYFTAQDALEHLTYAE